MVELGAMEDLWEGSNYKYMILKLAIYCLGPKGLVQSQLKPFQFLGSGFLRINSSVESCKF